MDKDLVEYFIKETNIKFDKLDTKLNAVSNDVNEMLKFKWQIMGGSAVLAAAASLLVTILINLIKG